MTDEEFTDCLEYLNTIKDTVFIEVEMKASDKNKFDTRYEMLTSLNVPVNSDTSPYYVWGANADKWGIELRMYCQATGQIPDILSEISTRNGRPGYENYNLRVNNNNFIWKLFENNYCLGQNHI